MHTSPFSHLFLHLQGLWEWSWLVLLNQIAYDCKRNIDIFHTDSCYFAGTDLMMYNHQCEMYVGAGGLECAMSWSQCSLLSTGHSAREFLWADWECITLCPHICPLKNTVIFVCREKAEVRQIICGCLNKVKVLFSKILSSEMYYCV